jgi:fatty acid desaturase
MRGQASSIKYQYGNLQLLKEHHMSRRRTARPSNRQILAIVAIILALLALTGLGGVPWLIIAVIVLALTHLI